MTWMSSALLTTSLTWGLKAVKTEGESLRAGHRKKSDPAEKALPADIFKQRAEKDKPGRRGYGEFRILFPGLFCKYLYCP